MSQSDRSSVRSDGAKLARMSQPEGVVTAVSSSSSSTSCSSWPMVTSLNSTNNLWMEESFTNTVCRLL